MTFLPDSNTCISFLRQKQPRLIARWQSTKVSDIVLCSVVVYELRHGAESSSEPFLTGDQSDAAGATGNIGYRPTTKCIAASVKTDSFTL